MTHTSKEKTAESPKVVYVLDNIDPDKDGLWEGDNLILSQQDLEDLGYHDYLLDFSNEQLIKVVEHHR